MFLWVLSGFIMSFHDGRNWKSISSQDSKVEKNYAAIKLSPANIVQLAKENGIEQSKNIQLGSVSGQLVYILTDSNNVKSLFNATSGKQYKYSLGDAIKGVSALYNFSSPPIESSIIKQHNLAYPWGELPVYKLKFESSSALYFINPNTAKVLTISAFSQIRTIAGMIHTFAPIRIITGSDNLRKYTLILFAFLSLAGTTLGVYLTLPRKKKKKRPL